MVRFNKNKLFDYIGMVDNVLTLIKYIKSYTQMPVTILCDRYNTSNYIIYWVKMLQKYYN